VDRQLAPFAHRTGPAQTIRLVETAITRFMPEYAKERRDRAADQRHFDIDHDQVSFAGTSRVHGELDLADALDLEDAVRAGAENLKALGSTDSFDVRRAAALGVLARGQHPLDLTPASDTAPVTAPDGGSTGSTGTGVSTGSTTGVGRFGTGRQVVLYAHLSADAIRSHAPDAVVNVENAGGQLLTTDQVAEWCGRADTAQVVVNPVIDLNTTASVDGYRVRESIAEKVRLRDRTCVVPSCHRPARGCDLDHIDPYVPTDEGGPPGQTSTENLACLCRLHHRMKTHAGWTYSMLVPGAFVWHSPHGHTWLRDPGGTTDLTTNPVEPPER
jgi:hypothetical protein